MADFHFRSAFNGYNREDVVHYIEYLNARHQRETAQLQSDLQSTQETLDSLRAKVLEQPIVQGTADSSPAPGGDSAAVEEIQQLRQERAVMAEENAKLQEERNALLEKTAYLTEENARLREECANRPEAVQETVLVATLRAQLESANLQRDEARAALERSRRAAEDELAAYRRAERTEREARERVSRMYQQAHGTLADVGAGLSEAAETLNAAADGAAAQLSVLMDAVARSREPLNAAAQILAELRPEEETAAEPSVREEPCAAAESAEA